MLRLEDLEFGPDAEGGYVVAFRVEGRRRTAAVPYVIGQVLETQNAKLIELERKLNERPSGTVEGNTNAKPVEPFGAKYRRAAKAKKARAAKAGVGDAS